MTSGVSNGWGREREREREGGMVQVRELISGCYEPCLALALTKDVMADIVLSIKNTTPKK